MGSSAVVLACRARSRNSSAMASSNLTASNTEEWKQTAVPPNKLMLITLIGRRHGTCRGVTEEDDKPIANFPFAARGNCGPREFFKWRIDS